MPVIWDAMRFMWLHYNVFLIVSLMIYDSKKIVLLIFYQLTNFYSVNMAILIKMSSLDLQGAEKSEFIVSNISRWLWTLPYCVAEYALHRTTAMIIFHQIWISTKAGNSEMDSCGLFY